MQHVRSLFLSMPRVLTLGLVWQLGCSAQAVHLNPPPRETKEYALELTGDAPPLARVAIRGAATKVVVQANAEGHFAAQIALAPNRVNTLSASLAEEADSVEQYPVKQLAPDVREALARRFEPSPVSLSADVELIGDRLLLRGRAEGSSSIEIEGGADVITARTNEDGGFTAEVPLVAREQAMLRLRAVDRFGNRSHVVEREAPAPLKLDLARASAAPLEVEALNEAIEGNHATLKGRTAPGARVLVTAGSEEFSGYADSGGRFAIGTDLNEGANTFTLRAVSADGAGSAAREVSTTARQTPHKSRYPIVLVHGMGGFDTVFGYEYWWGLEAHLKRQGYEVFVVEMTSLGTIERRAQQLLDQIRSYTSGKVNLIGHSQGCLDSRYMVSRLDASQVASVTLIAGPHRGSRVADVALGLLPGAAESAIDFLLSRLGWDWNVVRQLSERHMTREFNPNVPDKEGVFYQSWTGAADPFGWGTGVPLSGYLFPSWLVLKTVDGDASDGLVTVKSGKWGTFQGVMAADHVTEVGQIAGYTNGFDHKAFYKKVVDDLAVRGY